MLNIISKFNKYFVLSTFLLSVVAFQFGFLNSLDVMFLSSIDIFLLIQILICVSTKNIKKIFIPILIISFLACIYSSYSVFVLMPAYIVSSVIIFYLNKGPLFITDNYRIIILVVLSVFVFKLLFNISLFIFNYFSTKSFVFSTLNYDFVISIISQIFYSIIFLFIFKPDIKYINYEFLVGD